MKTPMKLVTDLAGRLLGARNAIGELRAADVALREAHAAAEAERQNLLSAKPPKADVLKALDMELERLASEWTAQRGMAVVSALTGALDVTPAGEVRGVVRYASLADELGALSLPVLAALAPALVREGLRAVIARTPFDEGAPWSERAALVADADRKIEAIVLEHAELVDNAAAAGIPLTHLAITVGRRTRAAQARARWEADGVANADHYARHPSARPPAPESAP